MSKSTPKVFSIPAFQPRIAAVHYQTSLWGPITLSQQDMRKTIRRCLEAVGLLGPARSIVRQAYQIIAVARARAPRRRNTATRSAGKLKMDNDFLQFAFHDDKAAVAAAVAASLGRKDQTIRLIGSTPYADLLARQLGHDGYSVERIHWSYQTAVPPEGLGTGILCEIPVSFSDWAVCASVTSDGAVEPIWRIGLRWSVLQEMLSIYEYNCSSLSDLIDVYRGRSEKLVGHRYNSRLERVERFFPLSGKTIIEFGPSDGNQTADLLGVGACHVLAVEGRPENIIKLLVAKWAMGWQNFEVILDNFQTPGAWATRRYDFVYAQGVYYHCQNPLIFLDMLTRLGNTIFIGGWVASDKKPTSPWISLEHDGVAYRAKVYTESYHFLSGLAAQSYMLERSEIERFLVARGFVIKYCDTTADENGLGAEFVEILAMRSHEKIATEMGYFEE